MWMMAKKPEHRPATPQTVLAELREIRNGGSGSARRHLREQGSRGFWNNSFTLGVMVGALLLLLLAGILWLTLKP